MRVKASRCEEKLYKDKANPFRGYWGRGGSRGRFGGDIEVKWFDGW